MSCEDLLIPDVKFTQNDVATGFSYLATITQDNFDQHKKNTQIDLKYGEMLKGSANYDEFNDKRTRLFQQYNFNYSFRDLSLFYESRLPVSAYDAYLACTNRHGFSARIERVDSEFITVEIGWNPAPGAPTKVAVVDVNIIGGKLVNKLPRNMEFAQKYLLVFSRDPNKQFLFTANVGGTAAQVFVPAYREFIPPPKLIAMQPVNPTIGGWTPIIINAEKRSTIRLSGNWARHYDKKSRDIVDGSVGFWLRIAAANGNNTDFPNDQQPHSIEVGQSAYYACVDPVLKDNDQSWEDWGNNQQKYETLFFNGPLRYYLYQ